jgi:hypothetical protein
MAEKHIRGEMLIFAASPKDELGNSVTPATIRLYLNYKHANGTISTDSPIDMTLITAGMYETAFDSKVCEPSTLFWSIRTVSPSSAQDGKISIVANAANPDP